MTTQREKKAREQTEVEGVRERMSVIPADEREEMWCLMSSE